MFMISLSTAFFISSSSAALAIAIKRKSKYRHRAGAMSVSILETSNYFSQDFYAAPTALQNRKVA
jgi:hypothetical protein